MREQPVSVPSGEPDRGKLSRQARGREVPLHPMRILPRSKAQPNRKIEGERHAERHRFAMQQPVAEPGLGFKRMTEGMKRAARNRLKLADAAD